MGEERKVCKVLVGKAEGKRPLGRTRRRWENGIRLDLREIGLGGVWIGFDWLRTGTGVVFWVILPCKMIVDRRFRGAYCLHHYTAV
jgi:hypothetical protein